MQQEFAVHIEFGAAASRQQREYRLRDAKLELRTCLAAPNCRSLIVFGTDDGNWSEPPSFARAGTMPPRTLIAPLLFDADFKPKPAYDAMLKVLQGR